MGVKHFLRAVGLITFFLTVVSSILLAQTGTIRGKIVEEGTNEPLPGANIVVVGMSLGTATDLNGDYTLRFVPVGKQVLRISYVGYKPVLREVTVSEGGVVQLTVALAAEAIMGGEVVVTAQARGQQAAINQQLSAQTIVNVVSEERLQELPDFNAAQALSRLPGIATLESSGEANKIVIRGLAPQFNQVAVSGLSLASTGSTQIGISSQGGTAGQVYSDRSVDLSMVTPYMIKTIEVFKSLTPDINANAIGGYVNMQLREAPSGLNGDLLWQSGYTSKTGKYDNYRAIASVSNRFWDEKIGAYALVNIEKYDRDADNMSAGYAIAERVLNDRGYNRVKVTNVQLNRHVETRRRFGANLILDYKYDEGIVRLINMFSRLKSDYSDYRTILNYDNRELQFRYQSGTNTIDAGLNSIEFENDFGIFFVSAKAGLTYSQNSLPYSPYYQFNQTNAIYLPDARIIYDKYPEDIVSNVRYRGEDTVYLRSMSLFSTEYKENNLVGKTDIKVPVKVGTILSGHFKFGGEVYRKNIKNDQNTPYIEPTRSGGAFSINRLVMDSILSNFPQLYVAGNGLIPGSAVMSHDSKLYKSFLGDRFGKMYWVANPNLLNAVMEYVRHEPLFNAEINPNASSTNPGGWFNGLFQRIANDYEYTEDYTAGYLMGNFTIASFIQLVGGARYEKVASNFKAYNISDARDPKTQTYEEVVSKPSHDHILPMGQIKVTMTNWSDFRYSYTHTLARPDFHQMNPSIRISWDGGTVYAGNPRLKPAISYNHDALLTFFSNELGLFSIGGFYKEVNDFIYYTQYRLYLYRNPVTGQQAIIPPGYDTLSMYEVLGRLPDWGATLHTYRNSRYKAYVKGVEVALETRLWYLPFPLNGVIIGANYSHIWSETRYPVMDIRTVRIGTRNYISILDSSRSGRLINQPNDIANAFIGYDYKGFSAKISFVYQGNSVSYVGNFSEQDGYTDDYYRIDISARQMLPITGLQLFVDINNVNNRKNVSRQFTIGGFTSEKYYGLTVNAGLRYIFGL